MLAHDFSAAHYSHLPDGVVSILWKTGLGKDQMIPFLLDKLADEMGIAKEDALFDRHVYIINSVLESLQAASDFGVDFFEDENFVVPAHLNHLLVARTLIDHEGDSAIEALSPECMDLLNQVREIEENPEGHRGEYSLARFAALLFEWQEVDVMGYRLASGQWPIKNDLESIIDYYKDVVRIPPPVDLADPTMLEMEVARKIQDVAFIINNFDNPDWITYGYISDVAESTRDELTASFIFGAMRLGDQTSRLWNPFRFTFEFCMLDSGQNPYMATYRFMVNSYHPMRLYSALCGDENANLNTLTLALYYLYFREEEDFRGEVLKGATDNFKSLLALAFPDLCPGITPTDDPEMIKHVHMISQAHTLFSLDYSTNYVAGNKVAPVQIPQDYADMYEEIWEALSIPSFSPSMMNYRNTVVERAKAAYTAFVTEVPELDLPALQPTPSPRKQNAQVLAFPAKTL